MDRKSILILVGCFVLLMLWGPLVNLIYPPPVRPAKASTNLVAGATAPGPQRTNIAAAAPAAPTISAPGGPAPAPWVAPAGPETLLLMETPEALYTFTSHGGGLKHVELLGFTESVGNGRRGPARSNQWATLNRNARVPALALRGGGALADAGAFQLTRTGGVVRAERELTNGLRIVKEFRFATNHLIKAAIRIENRAAEPLVLPAHELVIGSATPINPRDSGQFLGVQWYDGARAEFQNQAWFANRTLGCLPGTPRTEFQSAGVSNVVWAAVHNQFFSLIAAPAYNAPQLVAREFELPPPTREEREADSRLNAKPFGFEAALSYPPQVLPPGQGLEHTLDLFAGPKEYNTLAKLGKNQDLAMNFTTFFGWFAKALLLSMNGLHHGLKLSYGLTIIAITVIIKLLFWPLTQASTRSMKRMQALQPQMKALQEKYKEDPKKMNLKLMEFMKENKVNPMGGCLPMLLQVPVFIGFYQMLQSAIELRGASFLWAHDLSQPDTVVEVLGFPINPLPLIMGATQFWQARLTPPSPGVDPMQQKMMQYMPLIFLFILYNFPAGLALYWTVQNLLTILQMHLTKAAGGPQSPAALAKPPAPAAKKR
jgi:YidC/Oxa1 family membrane protein insertase